MRTKDIARVLAAVAIVENWDAKHPSIATESEGAWKLTPEGYPQPSRQLIAWIRTCQQQEEARKEHARGLRTHRTISQR